MRRDPVCHTFAWDGAMFGRAVPVRGGEVVTREGFVFADLLPAAEGESPGLAMRAAT